jgi:hypothetical protein
VSDLFDLQDLASALHIEEIDLAAAEEARRQAQAWLASATLLPQWPTPVPEDLRAWALELAAQAYDNPLGLASETVGPTQSVWSPTRRAEILTAARVRFSAAAGPIGVFPTPEPWPDPIVLPAWYPVL